MADSGERRMLFDTRGRRRNVIRVVYAVLALLMAGSLFLTVGPFSLSELAGGGSGSDAEELAEERAERIEERLAKSPGDEGLLLSLVRARINAGNAKADVDPRSGQATAYPADARKEFDQALLAWEQYLEEVEGPPNASVAQLIAFSYFRLAETSSSQRETESNVEAATAAQKIAAAQRPITSNLSTLAIYQYFNGEFSAGDRTAKQATAKVPGREAKGLEEQLAEYRKNAKQFQRRSKQLEKVQEEVGGSGGQSQNPFEFGGETPGG
ncbi:MAG TPA: hypothetical protein VFU04_05090 [Solirubrobacterales bacterium]|nr:hypothetical protein [Solirubrobacterales bacterium]